MVYRLVGYLDCSQITIKMSDTVAGILSTLKDMGFSEERANKALTKTGWKGVEPAMEWLLAHPEGRRAA